MNYIQASFNSGEWSPKLFARVDVKKYQSGAALLENFFIDYRGGASTRSGTRFVAETWQGPWDGGGPAPGHLVSSIDGEAVVGNQPSYATWSKIPTVNIHYKGTPPAKAPTITVVLSSLAVGLQYQGLVQVYDATIGKPYSVGEVLTFEGGLVVRVDTVRPIGYWGNPMVPNFTEPDLVTVQAMQSVSGPIGTVFPTFLYQLASTGSGSGARGVPLLPKASVHIDFGPAGFDIDQISGITLTDDTQPYPWIDVPLHITATAPIGPVVPPGPDPSPGGPVRLITFQISASTGYVLEFGNYYIRPIYNGAVLPVIIRSPYSSGELAKLKFAQNVTMMILCHPNHPPYRLDFLGPTNWTMAPCVFGSTISGPPGAWLSPAFATGQADLLSYYSYIVTAIDRNGQESLPSPPANGGPWQDIRIVAGSITIGWPGVTGAVSYNVYRAAVSYNAAVPAGVVYGYIGNTQGTAFIDDNISPDFSITPPVHHNPFQGSGYSLIGITLSSGGSYTQVPQVTIQGNGAGSGATAVATLGLTGSTEWSSTIGRGSGSLSVRPGQVYTARMLTTLLTGPSFNVKVTSAVDHGPNVNTVTFTYIAITAPINDDGTLATGHYVSTLMGADWLMSDQPVNIYMGVTSVTLTSGGSGYTNGAQVFFNPPGAAASAIVEGNDFVGNPTVPGFFQQRLVLAAPTQSPQTFFMSQPGNFFNFNTSTISQPTDAITATLVSGELNTIKSMVSQTSGLLMLTDRNSWIVTGGQGKGSAVSPASIVANAQSFNGASDVPPVVSNFDVLYVQSKGSSVRDSAYNVYADVFTGTDISVMASHLFYDRHIKEWAIAEEPFRMIWAVRDDGVMLTLTFMKEQEFIGWTHQVTSGNYESVCSVVETNTAIGMADCIYVVVNRGGARWIERVMERIFPNGAFDAWCVDAGVQYSGPPVTHFSGATHLVGKTVTGLADGKVIPPFVMGLGGAFDLPSAASKVTVGLPFTCKLQTLPLDLGDPTIQGKVKKISSVDLLTSETLGVKSGSAWAYLKPMKDFQVGQVSTMRTGLGSQVITDLVTGQGRIWLDPTTNVPGQVVVQQDLPLPATILGVVLDVTVGDGDARGSR